MKAFIDRWLVEPRRPWQPPVFIGGLHCGAVVVEWRLCSFGEVDGCDMTLSDEQLSAIAARHAAAMEYLERLNASPGVATKDRADLLAHVEAQDKEIERLNSVLDPLYEWVSKCSFEE